MSVSISIKEIKFLKNFGRKSVKEQDSVLTNNRMKPILEDHNLQKFLNINGAYVGLIRGLCDLAVKKKNLKTLAVKDELNKMTKIANSTKAML